MDNATPTPTPAEPAGAYLTFDQMQEGAKDDLPETDVHDVFGGTLRIKALSASQSAQVKKRSIKLGGARSGGGTDFDWAAAERLQFRYGVIHPNLTDEQVRQLHLSSGPSFQKVIKAIDELSGTDDESRKDAEADFREPGDD